MNNINFVLYFILISILLVIFFKFKNNDNDMENFQINKKKTFEYEKFDPQNVDNINERLIRDVVIGKKYESDIYDKNHKDFTRNDVDNYLLSQINFNDKINFDSNNRVDMVARVSELRTNNAEMKNMNGKTIAQIYNELTKDDLDKYKTSDVIDGYE